jgi:esterase
MKLNYYSIGAGPPLLILHGLLGSLDNWMPHAQTLSAQCRVFLLDLRNHGRSPHAQEFDYDIMATDLREFLHDHELEGANLLGHSMGGKVAMRFAQLHPELTKKLVVADMAPREYPPRYAEILNAMHALDLSQFQQRAEVDTALTTAAPDQNIRQFLLKNIGRDAQGRMRWKPNISALRENYHSIRSALPITPSFGGPTQFIRGGKSDYIRDADLALIRQIFPQAELATIPAAGHWVHAEAPKEFLRLVTAFLMGASEKN